MQGTLSDVQPGLRSFSQRTLTDVGSLVAETRQLVASANRAVTTVERDPMSLLFGDRREDTSRDEICAMKPAPPPRSAALPWCCLLLLPDAAGCCRKRRNGRFIA